MLDPKHSPRVRKKKSGRAGFLAALVLVLVAVGSVAGVGLRALQNEEAAVARELGALEEQYTRSAQGRLALLLDEEAQALVDHRPIACGVGDIVHSTRTSGRPPEAPATSPACAARIDAFSTSRAAARTALRAEILRDCEVARGPSGRLVAPMLLAGPESVDALVAWLHRNEDALGPHDRSTLRAMIDGAAYDAPGAAKLHAALKDDGSGTHGVPEAALLGDPAVAAALAEAATAQTGNRYTPFRGANVLGRVGRSDASIAAVVAHESSLRACAAKRLGVPADLVLTVEHSGGDARHPSAELAPELFLRFSPRSGAVAERTRRSRIGLGLLLALGVVLMVTLSVSYAVRLRRERRLSELRVDFLAAVSHELRTPVASLRMLTDLLVADKVPEADREEVHETLARETRRLGDTIERMLDFRRLLAGAALSRAPMAIAPFTEEVVRGWAGEGVVPVVNETGSADAIARGGIAIVEGDATMLRLALHNLLDNAKKYGGGPTAVRITGGPRAVSIRVEDAGPGIPAADLQRVFEPFERSGDRLSEATEGTGIGLAIVRHVAEGHGGTAYAEPRKEGGVAFVITIPILGRSENRKEGP
jgi:two-component system phosphate regulon sensor histidine kinase PhoR